MQIYLNRLRSILTLLFIFLYFANIFMESSTINTSIALIVIFLLLINLPFLTGVNKYVSLILFLGGLVLLIYFKGDITHWISAFTKNAGLICLLITVPLLAIPLAFEDFQQAISSSTQKYLNDSQSFYLITNILAYSMGMLINVAGISIVYQLLYKSAEQYPRSLFITALTRGYGCCVFWSPNFISVAVILHYLDLPWISIAPWGFVFAGISIFVAYVLQKFSSLPNANDNISDLNFVSMDKENTKILRKLIMLGSFLLFLIVILEYFTGKSVLVIVPLVAVIFPFVVAILWKKQFIYFQALFNYYNTSLPKMKNEIVLFTVAGFFGQALTIAGIGELLPKAISNSGIEHSFLYILLIIAIMVFPSLIGIHPVVSGSTIAVTLPVSMLPLMPIQYAMTLLTGWTLAILLSPFSGTVLVTAAVTNETPFNVGMVWNWRYALILSAVYILILPFIPI
ncbi:MAG: hypothetical protein VR72_00095 [Clostridiaceae bacterium BRH_c20a]|nr:MAG: hypothetical protein VR72_00095 [Clostridiaceae bacterium BRH_c20a]